MILNFCLHKIQKNGSFTLLHSEWPKFDRILAILSAIVLNILAHYKSKLTSLASKSIHFYTYLVYQNAATFAEKNSAKNVSTYYFV